MTRELNGFEIADKSVKPYLAKCEFAKMAGELWAKYGCLLSSVLNCQDADDLARLQKRIRKEVEANV